MEKINDDHEIHRKVLHDLLLTTENIIKGISFMTTSAFNGYLECKIQSPENYPTVILMYDNSKEQQSVDERSKIFVEKTELNRYELSESQNFIPLESVGTIDATAFELKKSDTINEKCPTFEQMVIDDKAILLEKRERAAFSDNVEITQAEEGLAISENIQYNYCSQNGLEPICEINEGIFNEKNSLSLIGRPSNSSSHSLSGKHFSLQDREKHTEEKPSGSYTDNRQNFPTTKHKPFVCNYCHKAFGQKHSKIRHMRIHTGEKPYQCNYCHLCFADITHRIRHERVHTGEKPYTCEYCDKTFSHPSHKKAHERLHTGEKPFNCTFCEMTFTSKHNKTQHERVHTGERPYCCSFCGKRFQSSSNKKCHEKIHTGERYTCDYCDQTFTQKSSKKSHEKRKHLYE